MGHHVILGHTKSEPGFVVVFALTNKRRSLFLRHPYTLIGLMDRNCPFGNCPLDPLSEANASKHVLQMKHSHIILLFTANEQND